jgi:flagellar biosynthesis protein FlhG
MKNTQVIGIASGKGGVGKTATSTNLAVALSLRGHSVMLFDADLGLANAQLALGCPAEYNFSHVLSGEKSLADIVLTTRHGIKLIPGASGVQHLASLDTLQASAIVQAFSELQDEVDYLIIDSAAGISDSVVTFMQAAQRRFIVLRDEPSSIADAYGTIKVLTQERGMDEIYLIPNMVPNQQAGVALHQRINEVCLRFLGKPVGYLHSVVEDEHMLSAIRSYQSVLEHAPGSAAARDFRNMATEVEQLPPCEQTSGGIQFFIERLVGRGAA